MTEHAEKVKAAAALVAAGLTVQDAAKAMGVWVRDVNKYMRAAEETRLGIGNSPFTATASLIVRLVIDELSARYQRPEDFGDIESDKALRKAIKMVKQLARWPDASDERIEKILQHAADYIAGVLAKRGVELSDDLLIKAGSAVASFAAVHVDEDLAKNLVLAEAVVKRRPAQSQVEPELSDRARRILQIASGEGTKVEQVPQVLAQGEDLQT